jgi:alanyl-tRNA synthetase
VQKVFRTPDIDEVGSDGFHLTFFEMLGNFSFGQYFKEGAIELAWEFMFEHMNLDRDRIWVTVFAGDPELGLGEDEVAIELWERIGMPPERIIRLPRADNFWSVGGPGPCGPDSEMFYDWGEGVGCGRPECAPGCDCERFLEFWNLVFMEYELHVDGTLTPLPKQNIDTGMGLERAARILQDVESVYDTDGYQAIMAWLAEESGVAYGDTPEATKAHRILADHGRGMTFLAGDGVSPSNEGRGYVMRRIMRRAIMQGTRIGLETPFLGRLADVVIDQMGEAYPELPEQRIAIHQTLETEEQRFSETLARGLKLFEELTGKEAVTGEQAFTLAATYGFPIELTVELAEEREQAVDVDEFKRLMEEHREISRAGEDRSELQRAADFAREAGFTTDFVGWEKTEVLTQIGALEELGEGEFLVKLRESPFYAEGGGQVSDHGWIEQDGGPAELVAAYRFGEDQALRFRGAGFAEGDRVKAVVPWKIRFPTMANHTGTHLLHKALQEVLGEHVRQAGSAVRPDKLRFDFTHQQALDPEERSRVERLVNERIFENLPVRAFLTPIDEARALGAMMLFGEKYGDVVRVVEIPGFSRELCGGTHVRSTAEIGAFVITGESSVGAGVRRIEAITSGEAFAYLHGQAEERERLAAELARARKEPKASKKAPDEFLTRNEREQDVGGVYVFVAEIADEPPDRLLQISDQIMQSHRPAAVVLGSRDNGRVHLLVNLDRSLEERGLDAVQVVREAAALVGGGGGGRPTMAQAGGRDPDKLPDALARAEETLLRALA